MFHEEFTSSEIGTILGGFCSSLIFIWALTAINNFETALFNSDFTAKFFPEGVFLGCSNSGGRAWGTPAGRGYSTRGRVVHSHSARTAKHPVPRSSPPARHHLTPNLQPHHPPPTTLPPPSADLCSAYCPGRGHGWRHLGAPRVGNNLVCASCRAATSGCASAVLSCSPLPLPTPLCSPPSRHLLPPSASLIFSLVHSYFLNQVSNAAYYKTK